VETWIQIQAESQAIARTSRFGTTQVPNLHLCEWLLLAFDHYDIMQDAIALYKAKMNIT
jgi:hypothetical protein